MDDFPFSAIDPDGSVVSVTVSPEGRLVTDLSPAPLVRVPYNSSSAIRVNEHQETYA